MGLWNLNLDDLIDKTWKLSQERVKQGGKKIFSSRKEISDIMFVLDSVGVEFDTIEEWLDKCEETFKARAKKEEVYRKNEVKGEYDLKNKLLSEYFESVKPYDVLRDLFPEDSFQYAHMEGERDGVGNGIVSFGYKNTKGKSCRRTEIVFDNLYRFTVDSKGVDAIYSPCSYWGKSNRAEHIDKIFGFIIDLDNVSAWSIENNLRNLLRDNIIPTPNYIINSGTGAHFYFLFDKPVLYHDNSFAIKPQLDKLKKGLTMKCWDFRLAYKDREFHPICHGYSVPGSCSRKDSRMIVTAFRVRKEKYTLEELNELVDDEDKADLSFPRSRKYTLEECKELFPDWYDRVILHETNGNSLKKKLKNKPRSKAHWRSGIGLYYWWLKICRGEKATNAPASQVKVGNRFWTLVALAVFAAKCDVPFDELKKDAYSLVDYFNSIDKSKSNKFYEQEVDFAIKMYHFDFACFIRWDWIHERTGIVVIKKRYKKPVMSREQALQIARYARDIKCPGWNKKTPQQRGESKAREEIIAYISKNPDSSINDYLKVGNYSMTSAYKYWESCKKELGLDTENPKLKKLREYVKSHPEASQRECERELGLSRDFIRSHWKELKV